MHKNLQHIKHWRQGKKLNWIKGLLWKWVNHLSAVFVSTQTGNLSQNMILSEPKWVFSVPKPNQRISKGDCNIKTLCWQVVASHFANIYSGAWFAEGQGHCSRTGTFLPPVTGLQTLNLSGDCWPLCPTFRIKHTVCLLPILGKVPCQNHSDEVSLASFVFIRCGGDGCVVEVFTSRTNGWSPSTDEDGKMQLKHTECTLSWLFDQNAAFSWDDCVVTHEAPNTPTTLLSSWSEPELREVGHTCFYGTQNTVCDRDTQQVFCIDLSFLK